MKEQPDSAGVLILAAAILSAGLGASAVGQPSEDPESSAPPSESWLATANPGSPPPRFDAFTAWTGTRMIVWGGGTDDFRSVGTGGAYDPEANSWTAVTPVNAPAAREAATAVSTGDRMIVWGGFRENGLVNDFIHRTLLADGGIYDPDANAWTAVSAIGAPAARCNHTAVWTGSKMIVWGGFSQETFEGLTGALRTGGIYDPVANTWQPTSIVGAPSARALHTAVWTGEKMIVWGGNTGHHSILGDGAMYDPESDSWTPVSGIGSPAARALHGAVWTGSRMVVWGGEVKDGEDATNTGGVFDPVGDVWAPTPISGAPSARTHFVMVALGGRVIIWSGELKSGDDTDTGGIYDPETDAWTATTRTGAPAPRDRATGVSTGAVMIAWGGFADDKELNTGGIYNPPFAIPPSIVPCVPTAPRDCVIVAPVGQPVKVKPRGP